MPREMTGALVPGLGPFMALLAPITQKLYEDRFRADHSRRLQDDPAVRRQEARRAFEQTLADEARRGTRSEPVASDPVSDFGL